MRPVSRQVQVQRLQGDVRCNLLQSESSGVSGIYECGTPLEVLPPRFTDLSLLTDVTVVHFLPYIKYFIHYCFRKVNQH